MSDEFSLEDAQTLKSYITWMGVVQDDLNDIASYVSNVVCGDAGYPKLMQPIVEALDVAASLYRMMTSEAIEKWNGTEQALFDVSRAYQREDGSVSEFFRKSDMEREIERIQKANEVRRRKVDEQLGGTY